MNLSPVQCFACACSVRLKYEIAQALTMSYAQKDTKHKIETHTLHNAPKLKMLRQSKESSQEKDRQKHL